MGEIDKKSLGQRIKSIRLDKGMTLEEFGKLFGASKSSVLGWENGRNAPNKERLKIIAKIGETTVEHLIFGDWFSYICRKFEERLPKDKAYLKGELPAFEIANIKNKIEELELSYYDEAGINAIIDRSIFVADEYFDNSLMLYIETIKKYKNYAQDIHNHLSKTWKLWNQNFRTVEDFYQIISSSDKMIYSQNSNYIEEFYAALESKINDSISMGESYIYLVKLKDFDKEKPIEEYEKSHNFFSPLYSFNSPATEASSVMGIYSPKEQALFVSNWYENGYKEYYFSKKHCVIYNENIYVAELLEDSTFWINNRKLSLDEVYYFSPLLGILY